MATGEKAAVVTAVLTAAGLVGGWFMYAQSQIQAIPKIAFVACREDGGYTVITLKNESTSQHANIHQVTFTVTDRNQLDYIAKIHPRTATKLPAAAIQHSVKCNTINDVSSLQFTDSKWVKDEFVYTSAVGMHLPRNGIGNDLRLSVFDPALNGMKMFGRVEFYYDASEPCGVVNVPIMARRKVR